MIRTQLVLVLGALGAAAAPALSQSPAQGPFRQAWTAPLGAARESALEVGVSAGERLLVLDAKDGVTALDPHSGALLWFVQMPGPISHIPSDGGAIALATGTTVVVVDGPSGRRLFQKTSSLAPATSPCSDGSLLYVPALLDDSLVAWNMATGTQAWSFRMPAPHAGPALMCGPAGARSVLLPGEDGVLRAIPAQAPVPRGERWAMRLGRVIGMPLIVGSTIFVGTTDRAVVALDAGSGMVKWRSMTGELPRTSPVVLGDGLVLGTTTKLLLLKQATGEVVWEQPSTDRPLGAVGSGLLARKSGGGCKLLEAATGRTAVEQLPGNSVAAAGWLVELRAGTDVVGWKPGR